MTISYLTYNDMNKLGNIILKNVLSLIKIWGYERSSGLGYKTCFCLPGTWADKLPIIQLYFYIFNIQIAF